MIISHRHQFIFFAIPKTGTHSIRQALRAHMGEQDLEQVVRFGKRLFPFPEFAKLGHGHISARQIQPVLGEDVFQSYFKFAFVRNPFDRFVSYCAFMSRETGHFASNPRGYMKFVLGDSRFSDHILFRPQWEIIGDADGQVMVDFIGRTERMQADYDHICDKIGLPSSHLGRANESTHRDYRDYYDSELIELVSQAYRNDLDLFGYVFDGVAPGT